MSKKIKLRGHESFFIRKGWLHKGVKSMKQYPDLFIDKSLMPTDILGVGLNMVKSIRYWMSAVGIIVENRKGKTRSQAITELGNIIYENDPYFEELGTLWILHSKLARNVEDATSWYYFFNEFQMQEFTKEDFCIGLKKYIAVHSAQEVADSSIESDFDCIINTYVSKSILNPEKSNPENNIDCPLGELKLVDVKNKKEKIYTKVIPPKVNIHPMIALAMIINTAKEKEVKIQSLLKDKESIGKIFNLDMITLLEILNRIEKMGYISIVRTAGLDVVRIKTEWTYLDCVKEYYRLINELGGELE